jgi:hypothetical protein
MADDKNPAAAGARLAYLDNLKVALTLLVIAHHVGQAYGPTGGSWPVMEDTKAAFLAPFFTVNRSFFMSLFFFISGYFTVAALERHGASSFARSRLVRLGLPVLAFMLILLPVRILVFHERIAAWDRVLDAGHLWYLEHVLLFGLVYAAFRSLREGARPGTEAGLERGRAPDLLPTLGWMLLLMVVTGAVRLWSPIDRWFNLLGFFRVAFADVPRDLGFFCFGVMAARRGWAEAYPAGRGYAWLGVGLASALAYYAWDLVPALRPAMGEASFFLVRLLWEGLLCFGMCIGLLTLFRGQAGGRGRLARFLAANQYSAYFWHPIPVVLIQMAALGLPLGPGWKFLLVTAVSVPVVFTWSALARRSKALRGIL